MRASGVLPFILLPLTCHLLVWKLFTTMIVLWLILKYAYQDLTTRRHLTSLFSWSILCQFELYRILLDSTADPSNCRSVMVWLSPSNSPFRVASWFVFPMVHVALSPIHGCHDSIDVFAFLWYCGRDNPELSESAHIFGWHSLHDRIAASMFILEEYESQNTAVHLISFLSSTLRTTGESVGMYHSLDAESQLGNGNKITTPDTTLARIN